MYFILIYLIGLIYLCYISYVRSTYVVTFTKDPTRDIEDQVEEKYDTPGPEKCGILNEIKKHVEVIQRLIKGHDYQNTIQKLGDQVCKTSKSDKCGHSSSLTTISRHIDKIEQVITEEKTDFQSSPCSFDHQTTENLADEVSVIKPDSIDKALNNSVVLRTIMDHLDDRNLLGCRLVNKIWKEEATIQLLSTRQTNKIKFEWYKTELAFRNKIGTLDEFTENCYGDPVKKFPCSQFHFEDVTVGLKNNENPSDLFYFLSNYGHHIKSLTLCVSIKSACALNFIRKVIFEWAPNLKSLTLNDQFDVDDDEDKPPAKELKNKSSLLSKNRPRLSKLSLEHLVMWYDYEVRDDSAATRGWSLLIQDILSSAPNIKQIADDELWFTKEIVAAGKTGVIHRLVWNIHSQIMKPRYEELFPIRPQLTYFEIDLLSLNDDGYNSQQNPPHNFFPNLQRSLQSNRETLKTLKFNGRFDLLTGASYLDIPVMEKLEEFSIANWNILDGGQGRLLPEGLSLKKSFPRLKILKLDDIGDTELNGGVDNPFRHECNSSTTVQELTISVEPEVDSHFQVSWVGLVRGLYPNIRVLHLDFFGAMEEISDIFSAIWTSWNDSLLEELSITGLSFESGRRFEIIDEALTGFDPETCKMLWKQSGSGHIQGEEELKRGPSILDMKKLKLLKLNEFNDDPSTLFPIFSRVAVIHALEPMERRQDLKVMVNGVELKKMIHHGLHLDFSICREHMEEN